jgi:hypothetical protein
MDRCNNNRELSYLQTVGTAMVCPDIKRFKKEFHTTNIPNPVQTSRQTSIFIIYEHKYVNSMPGNNCSLMSDAYEKTQTHHVGKIVS